MKEFKERVEYYQMLFGLDNWKVNIILSPVDVANHTAKTLNNPTYNVCTFTIYPQFLNTPSMWDETIIHELIHVVMALYDFYADNVCPEEHQATLFVGRENSVSQLTAIISRLMPQGKHLWVDRTDNG